MKVVYQTNNRGVFLYATEADECPMGSGYILPGGCVDEAPPEVPEGFVAVYANGWKSVQVEADIPEMPQQPLEVLHRVRRDSELSRADVQLNKVQDGMTGIGTQKEWRAYRVGLRNITKQEGFPEIVEWPLAPDAG